MPRGTGEKAAFIRKYPNLSPREIEAEAKKQGLTLSRTQVYSVRKADEKKARRAAKSNAATSVTKRGRSRPRKPATTALTSNELSQHEATFLRSVAEMGLTRARELLGRVEKAVEGLE